MEELARSSWYWSWLTPSRWLVRSIALQVRGVYSSFAQVDDIVNEGLLTLAR